MFNFIYNYILIRIAYIVMLFLRLVNKKVKERESQWKKLLDGFDTDKFSSKRIWFHASSMGEFEQAKPIIEILKEEIKDLTVIVSFYSPSGLNNQINYKFADYILYMPFDLKNRAKLFIDKINPSIAVFVRYDLWFNHLNELKQKNIPTYLICATKTNSQVFLQNSFFNSIYLNNLNLIDKIYTAGIEQSAFFNSLNIKSKIIDSADTRIDRIYNKVNNLHDNPINIKPLFDNKIVFIAGSTWKEDEEVLFEFYNSIIQYNLDFILIIVPHEPNQLCINRLVSKFTNAILYSELLDLSNNADYQIEQDVIIVNSIGNLLSLYSVANYAYVGGAFKTGIHSVVEPAGFGIPIFFGTYFNKSLDAINLVNNKSAFSINNSSELLEIFVKLVNDRDFYFNVRIKNFLYISKAKGESKRIAQVLKEKIENYSNVKSKVSE